MLDASGLTHEAPNLSCRLQKSLVMERTDDSRRWVWSRLITGHRPANRRTQFVKRRQTPSEDSPPSSRDIQPGEGEYGGPTLYLSIGDFLLLIQERIMLLVTKRACTGRSFSHNTMILLRQRVEKDKPLPRFPELLSYAKAAFSS